MSQTRRNAVAGEDRAAEIEAPADLRASRLSFGPDEYVVLSYPAPRRPLPATLTASEREVALLVAHGLSNAEIALARGVALRTVANQIASLFRKLGATSRLEVARRLAR